MKCLWGLAHSIFNDSLRLGTTDTISLIKPMWWIPASEGQTSLAFWRWPTSICIHWIQAVTLAVNLRLDAALIAYEVVLGLHILPSLYQHRIWCWDGILLPITRSSTSSSASTAPWYDDYCKEERQYRYSVKQLYNLEHFSRYYHESESKCFLSGQGVVGFLFAIGKSDQICGHCRGWT